MAHVAVKYAVRYAVKFTEYNVKYTVLLLIHVPLLPIDPSSAPHNHFMVDGGVHVDIGIISCGCDTASLL